MRYDLLSKRKIGKYLKYAIGEIILVVIGILIALQINNWNENRKRQNELKSIYEEIVFDLEDDIKDLSITLARLQEDKPVFDKVFSDERTVDLLDHGLSRIVAGNATTVFNKSGIERLKSISSKDTLSMKLIDTYNKMENQYILPTERRLFEIGAKLSSVFRDNYDWYPEWMSKRITKDNSSKELQNYFVNSREYRHYVIEYGYQVYTNYLPSIRYYIKELEMLKAEIKETMTLDKM